MKRFAALYAALDSTTSTRTKVAAMRDHFASAPPADAAWAAFFLAGRRFKRLVAPARLREWTLDASGLPEWLFAECYAAVGDLAETAALLLDRPEAETAGGGRTAGAETGSFTGEEGGGTGAAGDRGGEWDGAGEGADARDDVPLHVWVERLRGLRGADPDEQRRALAGWWRGLDREEAFLLGKLLTGGLRVGVSRGLLQRALAEVAGLPPAETAHRLAGRWEPSAVAFEQLVDPEATDGDRSRPYPFFLASPLAGAAADLGRREEWLAEWKWDGLRAQLVRRSGATWLWSRGEELIGDRFPELVEAAASLPDGTVLDGEVLAWRDGAPQPFALLQTRIGRQRVGPKTLAAAPAAFVAYDLLEAGGEDQRTRPLAERRQRLEALLAAPGGGLGAVGERLRLSEAVETAATGWEGLAAARGESRGRGVEGLMLKRLASPYRSGRRRGDWWKWKADPFTLDAVMVYAQAGHGRRANLFTDYTFAVWRGEELVPVAKAYTGLSDDEVHRLDRWIRRHTRERFGPVRAVEAVQVFEIAFEGIARSSRHKSGLALRFPRIARWRTDKPAAEADTLEAVAGLLDD